MPKTISDFPALVANRRQNFFKPALGNTFTLISLGNVETEWVGRESLLALADFPQIKMEYDGLSAEELNPIILDLLSADFPGKVGENIRYQGQRLRISTVQPVYGGQNQLVNLFILCYADHDPEG